MTKYQAPTDFRATKIVTRTGDVAYLIKADGYDFAMLEAVSPFMWEFRSLIAEELGVPDGRLVPTDHVAGFLASLKPAYLAYDRYCYDECQADLATERAVEAYYEEGPAATRGWAADEAARHGDF